MADPSLKALAAEVGHARIVSTDVFDTLLIRNFRSQTARIWQGECQFSRLIADTHRRISPDLLFETRVRAQQLAFLGLSLSRRAGEVRFDQIVGRQLRLLGLPESLIADRLQIEIRVELVSLAANHALVNVLKEHRSAGATLIAVSDTILPEPALRALINHFCGFDLIHRVYSSADLNCSKRGGSIFPVVAALERAKLAEITHVGDDPVADVAAPREHGMTAYHLRPAPFRHHVRRANGGVTEATRQLRQKLSLIRLQRRRECPAASDGILGPVITKSSMLIWLYAVQAETDERPPVLLFSARGGGGVRRAVELSLERLGLPLGIRRTYLMLSPVIAARAAVAAQSEAAITELDREFNSSTFVDVARALGGHDYDLPPNWRSRFSARRFFALLASEGGRKVARDIKARDTRFRTRLRWAMQDSTRALLCDSTLSENGHRLLAAGIPDVSFETVQLVTSSCERSDADRLGSLAGIFEIENSDCTIRSLVSRLLKVPKIGPGSHLWPVRERAGSESQVAEGYDYGRRARSGASLDDRSLRTALTYIKALRPGDGVEAWQKAKIARVYLRVLTNPAQRGARPAE